MSSSPPPPPKLNFTLPIRTKLKGKKRDSDALEQLELPHRQKISKIAHEPEQAEAGPSTPRQQEFSVLVPATPCQPQPSAPMTLCDNSSPSPAQDLTTRRPVIKTVSRRKLSPLSTIELLNFMRVDMTIDTCSSRPGLSYHWAWIHHKKAPIYPASLGPLPIEPRDTIAYAESVIRAATKFIQWQLSDIREVTDRVEAKYPLFGPPFSELSALQRLSAKPNVSLYELVSVHYPSPPLVGNVALIAARVEDLIDELNRYQLAMKDEDLGSLDPPLTSLLPIEERNCPAGVAALLERVAKVYGLGEFRRENSQELSEKANQVQMRLLQDTQPSPLRKSIEQEQVLLQLEDHHPSSLQHEPNEQEHVPRQPWCSHTPEPDVDNFMQEDFDPPDLLCAIVRRKSFDEFSQRYLEEMSDDMSK
ncbi:hypothetical protein MMC17_006253 [Xylographa soralifera]|nr:hypothetical protein [Xylographa soralifera]